MSISIIERKLENGRSRLILDSYLNGKRKTEKMELFVFNKPSTREVREANKLLSNWPKPSERDA